VRSPAPSRRVLRPQRRQDHDGATSSSEAVVSSSSSEAAAIVDVYSSSVAMEVETAETEVAAASSPADNSSSSRSSDTSTSGNIASADGSISMTVDKADASVAGITGTTEDEEQDPASATSSAAASPPSEETIEEGPVPSLSTGDELQAEKALCGEVQGENSIADGSATGVQTSLAVVREIVTEVRAPNDSEKVKEEVKGSDLALSAVPKDEEDSAVKEEAEEEREREGEGIVDLMPVKSESAVKLELPLVPAVSSSSAPLPESVSKVDPALDAKPKESVAIAVVPPLAPETLSRAPDSLSAIHALRGFMDVGNASLFHPSEPWVLATAALLAKRKLSKG
jgi:VIT1/CCC1 family predicted Fe2+/Mn2+ transporter